MSPDRGALHRDGDVLLRQAIPADWIPGLRAAFDAGAKPSEQWPVPRSSSWRLARVDPDPAVQCLYASWLETASLRGVRMVTSERFEPP